MSRRSNRKAAASRGKRGRSKASGVKWMWRILSLLALLVVIGGFSLYFWMQSYLRSDEFRVFIGDSVGGVIDSKAEFELFEWEGLEARTDGFHAESRGFLREMRADGLQGHLSLDGVQRGVWEISDLRIKKLTMNLVTDDASSKAGGSLAEHHDPVKNDEKSKDGGFFANLLPNRAELLSAEVMSMDLSLNTASGHLTAKDLAMRATDGGAPGSYDLQLSGGEVESSWFKPTLDLVSARGKYQRGRLFIADSRFQVYERGLFTLNGEVEGDTFGFFCTMKDVKSEELVPKHWRKSITGDVETKFKLRSGAHGVVTRGEIELKQGVLSALPVLDRIAAYANSRRFRRLNLSEARLKFWKEGKRLDLTEIVMASEGLVRLEGSLTIIDGRLNGRFKVGVMPGMLAHIPGAESKVFIRGDRGLLWTPLQITGTVEAPQEDLSNRMIAAAGERMFELVPETGLMALRFAHDTATQLPEKAVETGVDVIREGTGVIQEGVRGVFDLLPIPAKEEDK